MEFQQVLWTNVCLLLSVKVKVLNKSSFFSHLWKGPGALAYWGSGQGSHGLGQPGLVLWRLGDDAQAEKTQAPLWEVPGPSLFQVVRVGGREQGGS